MTFLVATMNCLTSNIGYQIEADIPFLYLIKSKNICLLNINGKLKTNGSQILHLRWSSEIALLHRKIDVIMKTRLSVAKFYPSKFEFWFSYNARG